jgi:cytochrome c-type biogenesis protein CcmE
MVAALVCGVTVVWMLTILRNNVEYLRPVSDAVAHRASLGDQRFRMGGTVVPGTIKPTTDGARFEVMQGGAIAQVDQHGDPPDLFKDCAPVVVEGHWAGAVFDSDTLLIRHGNEYDPKKRVDANCTVSSSS